MQALTKKSPVAVFYVLTLCISWTYWIFLILSGKTVSAQSTVTHFPGLFGPFIAAYMVTYLIDGAPGVKRLAKSTFVPQKPLLIALFLAASPIFIGLISVLCLSIIGNRLPSYRDFLVYPGITHISSPWLVLLTAFLINGCGEEAGWRGFALPQLHKSLGRFKATIVVGSMWLMWHAPLFILNEGMHALIGPTLLGWGIGLMLGAFVLAHVYFSSNRSVLVVALWHTLYNFVVSTDAGKGLVAAIASALVMVWGSVVAINWWFKRNEKANIS